MGFSEPVLTPGLSLSRFGVSVDGVVRSVTAVSPGQDLRQRRLTFSGAAPTASQIVRLLYSDLSTANDESGVVQDAPGNDMLDIAAVGRSADTFFSIDSVMNLAPTTTHLILLGSAAIRGSGNSLNNRLIGNKGSNVLDARAGNDVIVAAAGMDTLIGGIGIDTLTGGGDSDTFRFNTSPNTTTNRDVITDFSSGFDTLSFSRSVYAGFPSTATTVGATQFRSGAGVTTASSSSQRFIYDTSTGILRFDRDGSLNAVAPIQVAVLGAKPQLLFSDLLLTS
ncbi:MAG: calcium-binding protein [Cyanobium sp.]